MRRNSNFYVAHPGIGRLASWPPRDERWWRRRSAEQRRAAELRVNGSRAGAPRPRDGSILILLFTVAGASGDGRVCPRQ